MEPGLLNQNKDCQPVCITGMHRSGTSTLAQILYRLGLDLGHESDLFQGNVHNEDGYFENKHFVKLNQRLLDETGYGWDFPPQEPDIWRDACDIQAIESEAKALISGFEIRNAERAGRWGWKDPRNSVTMPFWLRMNPELRVIVSLRNPLEVAASLHRRGNASTKFALNLWEIYNQRILQTVPPEMRLIVSYERLFVRPRIEIRRMLDFAGLFASDQLISLVRSRVIRGLRHHRFTSEDIEAEDPSGSVSTLYSELLEQSTRIPVR